MPKKGFRGYFKKKKLKTAAFFLILVAIGLIMVATGFAATHTKKNLLTVFGILFVLPAAKYLTVLITMLPYKEMPEPLYNRFHRLLPDGAVEYSDLVFTSSEKIMHLDYLVCYRDDLIAYSSDDKKNDEKICSYFTESLSKRGTYVHMHIFHDAESTENRLSGLVNETGENAPAADTLDFIQMIIV